MTDIGSFASPRISICNSTVTDMKSIEIENEKVERHISTNEKRKDKQSDFESRDGHL